MVAAAAASVASQAQAVLRGRLCDPGFVHSALRSSPDTNYSKLKYLVASSVSEACNNSVLLLGPRGCGKAAVVDMVLEDLKKEHPDAISVIRLNGMLHSDDNCATKEIARQLCLEHQLSFSKMASSDDNTEFIIDMLRECGLAHKTILFILEEFDLFAQGKQRLLYSLLDAMQSLTSQAVVIGVSCRLNIFSDKKFKGILNSLMDADATTSNILRFLAVSYMDMESGFLSMESFLKALSSLQRQPKMDSLQDLSILELYILVCMHRLEDKEQSSYNFTSIMKEYRSIQDAYKTSDKYASTVCFRAFEHLLDRELISFGDNRGRNQALEYRPVKLLISSRELAQSLKLNTTCPALLQKLFDRERYM
ncbi:hypothetical protein SEVIR_5G276200v4 [Setaria viridis]|uniref:Origin of replication complex subunit 4 n=2 Tax=Setaria TaxID=4554 RepID=A0A368R997_SETIT|nr:origin of replication complex subunit 4 isoform X4 [Setaria viridis]RCV26777.1 hypothetical protein SETIT_5G273300v2 [Setaria italica]TKW16084.1 hypothetical protein SEVIR_5G276200v2 [Setaria viridis]